MLATVGIAIRLQEMLEIVAQRSDIARRADKPALLVSYRPLASADFWLCLANTARGACRKVSRHGQGYPSTQSAPTPRLDELPIEAQQRGRASRS
jgi:hypothetical protein